MPKKVFLRSVRGTRMGRDLGLDLRQLARRLLPRESQKPPLFGILRSGVSNDGGQLLILPPATPPDLHQLGQPGPGKFSVFG